MWIQDLKWAINEFEKQYGTNILFHDIKAAFDGIVFYTTTNTTYKYWYESQKITKLDPNWRNR